MCRDGVIAVYPTDRFDRQTDETHTPTGEPEREREKRERREEERKKLIPHFKEQQHGIVDACKERVRKSQGQRQSNRRPENERILVLREVTGAVTNDLGAESTVTG